MKKLLFLFALLLGTVGAWAQTSYTVSATTGTANKSGYFATWSYTTSDANPAALKLAVQGGANNMKIENEQLQLWVGSGCTYTLQVPVFYRIVSYSFDFVRQGTYAANESVTLTVGEQTYTATTETQTVTVNNVNAGSTSFKMTGSNKGIVVTDFVVVVDCAFEVTTDETKPIWHTIKNVRGNVYAYNDGDSRSIGLSNAVANGAYLFYFTAGTTAGTYKIHSYVTSKKCADFNSWTDAGIDWYITPSANTEKPGWAISKNADHTGGWNNAGNSNTYVAGFSGDDVGSTWEIARYDYESVLPTVLLSTAEKKVLHYIRSIRRDSYVNFDGHNVTFKEGNLGLASYWYFVQDEEAQKNAPAGFLACRIFNAAHATGVENHSSGYMGDESWPARVYYIGTGGYERYGYLIYRADANLDNNGYGCWHDNAGGSIMDYHKNDAGSYWRIYPADKTEEQLKSEAATAKTNALNTIAVYEEADYYAYLDENIATAKTTINAVTNDNLVNATSGWMAINAAMATLEASAKGSTAPVAGDYIQLKNKHHNKYLKALESDAEGVDSKADLATIWEVVAGANGNVKLKNVSTEKYIGQVRQSATVAMTDEANAAEFSWTNQDKVYAVFKDVTGGDYAYGHVNGGKLVGWLPDAASSQWVVSQAYPLTVVYMYNGEEIAEHKVETYFSKGDTYTINNPYANSKKYVTLGTCTATGSQPVEADGTWSVKVTEATSITVTVVDDLPFKVSESYANATWYYMNIRSNDKKYVAMSDATEYSNTKTSPDEKGLWAFMGDANGIQIINKAAGEGKTLSFEGEAAGDKAVVMREEVKTWTIERAATGFLLRAGNTGNLYVHDLGGKLKIWNSTSAPTDKGSAFNVVEDKGVKSLEELVLNPRYIDIYTIQAERSPLMYSATETTKLSSGMLDGVAANENDVNQQFLILRTASTPENYFYLYSLGAEKFVDETLKFIDYPAPVLSFEASEHTVYPWRVKVDNKYVIPGDGGNDGNKLHHTTGGDDDEGKRYRIVKVGQSDDYSLMTKIEEAEDMIKLTSELSNDKVYTVSTVGGGNWYHLAGQEALWSTGKAEVEANSQDVNQQFAFLTVSEHTYLYSISAEKFVIKKDGNTEYSDVPSQAIELLDAEGSRFYPFVAAFVNGDERHHIGISNGYDIPVITSYNDLNDHGNKIQLREVTPGYMPENAEELLEAALTKIDTYLATQELKPELAGVIAQAQELLDKNYLDTEDATVLTNAKDAAQAVYDAPTSSSAALTEQINLLTAAIDAVTYVTEVADFKNCYVYTLVSPRGWMVATDANTVKSADEGAANNPLHQWAVYKSVNNKYYLYNIGKQQFMGFANVQNDEIPFAATPQMTTLTFKKSNWEDYPIMFSVDNVGVVNNNERGAMIYWNNGWTNLEDPGNNHKVTIVGAVPSETLTDIENAVVLFEATHALDVAIAAVQAKVDVMDKLGYYSSSNENFEAEFNAIKDFKAAITAETTVDAINAQTTAANNLVATFTVLNKPQTGKFYRIKNNAGNGYLSSGESGRTQFKADIATDASSIFGYIDGKLLSYKNGMYIHNDGGQLKYAANPGEGIAINFVSSLEPGKLQIHYYTTENRYLYSGGTGNTDAGRDAANTTEARYRFTVEEVTTLPFTFKKAALGFATFKAPVNVELSEGVVAYIAEIIQDKNQLKIRKIVGNVVPANTPVMLYKPELAEDETVDFNINNVTCDFTAQDLAEQNNFYGTVAAEAYPSNETVYSLQKNKNSDMVGFYKKASDTTLGGFKAWIKTATSNARAFTIIFDGDDATGLKEALGLENENVEIYDLSGRRLDKPTKGVNVVGGKLVIK